MAPEQKARQQIDRQLEQAGWIVQDYAQMNISAGPGVAVREFRLLTTGNADYMLYADAKAVGVIEAKPKGHTLSGVETQSGKYLDGLPKGLPRHRLPLPFAYESTGEVTQFTNTLEPDCSSRAVFTFHRPEELIRLVKLDTQMRTRLREMPALDVGHLWRVQIESIKNLEASLEPTEEQVAQIEREQMSAVLKTFHSPKLRGAILAARGSLEQVIDEQTVDQLVRAGFDAQALEKARSMLTSFRKFIEDNKDEIEALQILYSRPYRAGLRFRHVKELAAKLKQPPFHVDPNRPESLIRLWQAYEVVEPDKVRGKGGKQLVDVIALVRHAIDPDTLLAPIGVTVEDRYQQWISEKQAAGVAFTADQRKWLDAIKDHIASSLNIEQDDLEDVPFNTIGGLGRAYQLFGEKLGSILDELNRRLAA